MNSNDKKRIKSIDKAAAIIGLLAGSATPLSLSAVANELGIVKSTLHGLISALVDVGYVAQEAETGRYFLGYKLFEIGNTVSRKWNERQFAYSFMQRLAELTRNTIHLAVLDEGEVLYIYKRDTSGSATLASDIGVKLPAHCTGVGKVLLSGLSPYELKRFVREQGLHKYTEFTITDLDTLINEMEKIREQGYATDTQELVEGLSCVAAPIYSNKGEITSALSIAGPTWQMQGIAFEKRKNHLLYATYEISKLMGYQGERKVSRSDLDKLDMHFEILVHHQEQEYSINCRPTENVYKAVSRSGYEWAWSGCAGGGCGICKVQLISGTVVYRRMSNAHVTEAEKEQGIALACCITPTSDIELVLHTQS